MGQKHNGGGRPPKQKIVPDDPALTIREVAQRLRCTDQHVHSMIAKGRLEAFNIASDLDRKAVWRIRPEAVVALENHAA